MKNQLQITAAAFLVFTGSATAQNVLHDGLINAPLGSASLSEDANGNLVV
jgi:hypothetical protein